MQPRSRRHAICTSTRITRKLEIRVKLEVRVKKGGFIMPLRADGSRVKFFMAVILGFALAACDDTGSTGPGSGFGQPQFSRDVTFEEFQDILEAEGTIRVEIELLPGQPLVAGEVEIESPDEVADEEKVESRILGLPGSDCAGTGRILLTLEPAEVQFSSATEFEDDAADEDDISCEEFVSRVQAALNAGEQPPVEAERPPPVGAAGTIVAQAPDDPVFGSTEIELEDGEDEDELEINIDMDNLGACGSGAPMDCLGVLTVLNVPIFIVDGVTELEAELDDLTDEFDFEGIVASVELDSSDPTLGSVTLADGRVIRVVMETEIEDSGDDDRLASLEEVKTAVEDDGETVEVEGEGVEGTAPNTIVAIEIRFEIEDD